jgi:hypothetical protein
VELAAGDQVFWTDPDQGWGSGWYTIKGFDGDGDSGMVLIENDEGAATEAERSELSLVKP